MAYIDPDELIGSHQLEAACLVTRTGSRSCSTEVGRQYTGVLSNELRVGRPLVLYLDNGRRLITSTITRIQPLAIDSMDVETANSRYCVRRVVARQALARPLLRLVDADGADSEP